MGRKQYIGPRFVLALYENSVDAHSMEWEANTSYEPLIMVTYNGSSYISRKEVPPTVGAPTTNPSYWALNGSYNGQIAHLQDEIDNLETSLNNIFYRVDPTMTSDEIKDIVDEYDNIYFPVGTYEFTPSSDDNVFLNLHDNMNLWIDGTIKMNSNSLTDGCLINMDKVNNISIFGNGTIYGDKENHGVATGEHQHGITVFNSKHVSIRGITSKYNFGDGIYIGGDTYSSEYVTIDDVVCTNNWRNAISIVNAKHVVCTDSKFINSSGTAPQAGLSLETNSASDNLDDINVNNCECYGNSGVQGYVSTHNNGSVNIYDCMFERSSSNIAFSVACLLSYNALKLKMDGCTFSAHQAIEFAINHNSECVVKNAVMKDITIAPIRMHGYGSQYNTCNNVILDCVVVNSNIAEGFAVLTSTIVDSDIKMKLINCTITDIHTLGNIGDNKVELESNTWTKISSNNYRIGGSKVNYLFDDTTLDYRIDLTDNYFFDGTKYTIVNKSTDTTMTIVGTLPLPMAKSGDFTMALEPNSVITFERINGIVIVNKYMVTW